MTTQIMHLAGEQAEAFDHQMNADRDWFDSHRGVLCFRPQIPGECNEQHALGIPVTTYALHAMQALKEKGRQHRRPSTKPHGF